MFTRQRGVKTGYFYWLRIKNSNRLHTELSLGYLKDTKFYLESKASFIDIALLHLSCFWLLGCGNIALFRTVLWLAWTPRLGQNKLSWELSSEKKIVFLHKTFVLVLSKIRGSPCSFKRKGEFLTFCTCTRSCARANDTKIVRSGDAQCNTKELPSWILGSVLQFLKFHFITMSRSCHDYGEIWNNYRYVFQSLIFLFSVNWCFFAFSHFWNISFFPLQDNNANL